jgi:tetratricopeptide (TPR) repeat protein
MLQTCCGLAIALLLGATVDAGDDVYAAPRVDDLRSKVLVWAAEQPGVDAARQEALRQLWTWEGEGPAVDEFLERVIESFALIHPGVAQLAAGSRPPSADLLSESSNPFFRANVALYAGRLLVERRMYDEALAVLEQVDVREAVDPAALFFHRAVAAQGLLEIKPALDALDALLNRTENVPVRYSTTAVLLQADLQNLREKSLGEIARLMSDSERRLELGRAGEKVQGVQERIINNLDELIKKLEALGSGGGGGGSGKNSSNNSSSPAQDSTVKGATAPGLTDPKKLSKEGSWGNLQSKEEQAKAKQMIHRNFPSHYRQAIETYFKKLASRPATEK